SAPWPRTRSSSSAELAGTNAPMIWPPSKAISIRTRSSAATDDLRENAVDGIRMDEGDLEAEEPAARPLVDQLRALRGARAQRLAHVVDLVRHVMHAGTALGEKLADGRLVSERGQQLDP